MHASPKIRFDSLAKVGGGGSEERYHCPFCVDNGEGYDRKGKLYLHICGGTCAKCRRKGKNLTGLWRCWRCGARGFQEGSYLNQASIDQCVETLEEMMNIRHIEDRAECPVPSVGTLDPAMQGYQYFIDRGFTPEDIASNQIHLGMCEYEGRIVIPDWDKEGRWTHWVARDYVRPKTKLKYIAPSTEEVPYYHRVFRLDRLTPPRIIFNEGTLSAMATGPDASALYGKDFTEDQLQIVRDHGFTEAVCMLDGEAAVENLKLAKACHSYGMRALVAELPNGLDPADLLKTYRSREPIRAIIDRAWLWSEHAELLHRFAQIH